jgi:beta-galactosidase
MNARTLIFGLTVAMTSAGLRAETARVPAATAARTVVDLDDDWRFSKGDVANAMIPAFDDSLWRTVDLPHDWSSEGPFAAEYASGTGYAPGGVGWYRKHFTLDAGLSNKLVEVEFDGVYDYGEVWLNGHFVGGRPYGYSSFECLLTPLVRFSRENVLAVRVDHSRFADSRWYTGSGIYRHVRLRLTDKLRIAHWGLYITTPEVTPDAATVRVETALENGTGQEQSFALESEILAPDGRVVAELSTSGKLADGTNTTVVQQLRIASPQLWSPESPLLYALKSRLLRGTAVADQITTPFGIRTLRVDADKGFSLNGTATKLKGVCIHHEAGCLGAAVPDKVLERRLRILKEIGVNAIRTSHNPPAPELLELCDRLGFLVMDEAFDEFTPAKNKWVAGRNQGEPSRSGYAELFEQWSVRDISDMVRRDRNHPCIVLWSIGNEIDYRNDPFSHPVLGNEYHPANPPAQDLVSCARPLIAAVKGLDPTRPVTAALATVSMSDAVGFAEMLDAVGYNYQESRYADDHQKFPKRFIYGSENSGGWPQWVAVRDHDYVSGQFLWTGIDYLGEAGPWPNRGSRAGLLDLCGFKKPRAWFRQSLWSAKPMVYLCASARGGMPGRRAGGGFGRFFAQESWNWPSNTTADVTCYTTSPEVILLLNGRPVATNQLSQSEQGALNFRVPFEPGVLEARGLRNGQTECAFTLKTAGPAARIELLPDVNELHADGRDICHMEFQVVDAQGVRVPDAEPDVKFTVAGPARIIGLENGDLNSPATGKDGLRKAYRGRGLAIVQSTRETGKVRFTAQSDGLKEASVEIEARP